MPTPAATTTAVSVSSSSRAPSKAAVLFDSGPHHLSAWDQLALEQALTPEQGCFTRIFGLWNDAIIGGKVGSTDLLLAAMQLGRRC